MIRFSLLLTAAKGVPKQCYSYGQVRFSSVLEWEEIEILKLKKKKDISKHENKLEMYWILRFYFLII